MFDEVGCTSQQVGRVDDRLRLLLSGCAIKRGHDGQGAFRVRTEAEGDALMVSGVDPTSARGGSVRILNGAWIIYTPPTDLLLGEVDSFGYRSTDATGTGQGSPALQESVLTISYQSTTEENIIRLLTISTVDGDELKVRIQGVPNADYRIEESNKLEAQAMWSPVAEVLTDAEGLAEYSRPLAEGETVGFFRCILSEPE